MDNWDGVPPVMSVSDVADVLKVCDMTVRREIQAGRMSHIRVGRAIRVTRPQLVEYMRERTVEADEV